MGGTSKKRAKEVDTDAPLGKKRASKNGKVPKGFAKKSTKPPKEPEKVAKKRAKKPQDNVPKKRTRSSKKKKDESSDDDDEAYEEAEVDDDDVAEEDNEREEVSEDEGDGKTSDDKRTAQVRLKARRRGYRHVSRIAGYSPHYVSSASHLDVSTPVLSDNEVIRACQWAPLLADKPAYAGITEFEERTQLSFESLPKSAAKVIRQSGEAYLRRLTLGAMQRASDQQKTRASVNMVQAETRPLQRIQKYSFVAPHGLVRFAQGHDNANCRINKLDEDVEQMAAEKKGLLKDQSKKREAMLADKAAQKKKKGDEDGEPDVQDEPAAKKRKKRTGSA